MFVPVFLWMAAVVSACWWRLRASDDRLRACGGCTPYWPFLISTIHVIISELGGDMPFWLQFALVISSIHIEMRLSPPPNHNVITALPSQRRKMELVWQEWSTIRRCFLSKFIRLSNKSQAQQSAKIQLRVNVGGRVSLNDILLSFFSYNWMFWPFQGGWPGSHRLHCCLINHSKCVGPWNHPVNVPFVWNMFCPGCSVAGELCERWVPSAPSQSKKTSFTFRAWSYALSDSWWSQRDCAPWSQDLFFFFFFCADLCVQCVADQPFLKYCPETLDIIWNYRSGKIFLFAFSAFSSFTVPAFPLDRGHKFYF